MAEKLYRSAPFELRSSGDGSMPTMTINFARFNEWTEINSIFEGNFMEQFAPGAFAKTFKEQRIQPIFQHGRDPIAGDKPLGSITDLAEKADGAWGDVQLLNADYVRQIVPGLEAGVYGASFAFQIVKEEVNQEPARSDANPNGIPEHTVREVKLREFGPVTYPAYEGTSAGVRSLSDDFINLRDPDVRDALFERLREQHDAAEEGEREDAHEETSSDSQREPVIATSTAEIANCWVELQRKRWPSVPA